MKALKNEMRAKAKLIRAGLDYTSESSVICGLISRWDVFQKAKNIMLFYPIGSECSLLPLLSFEDKNFFFPVVKGDNMFPVKYDKESGFVKGAFGINEPAGNESADINKLDIVFVPALAVDLKGYRLGYGKGYYDRFLNLLNKNCSRIVPIFSELIFESVPIESHDLAVDAIVSSKGVIHCPSSNLACQDQVHHR